MDEVLESRKANIDDDIYHLWILIETALQGSVPKGSQTVMTLKIFIRSFSWRRRGRDERQEESKKSKQTMAGNSCEQSEKKTEYKVKPNTDGDTNIKKIKIYSL